MRSLCWSSVKIPELLYVKNYVTFRTGFGVFCPPVQNCFSAGAENQVGDFPGGAQLCNAFQQRGWLAERAFFCIHYNIWKNTHCINSCQAWRLREPKFDAAFLFLIQPKQTNKNLHNGNRNKISKKVVWGLGCICVLFCFILFTGCSCWLVA